MTSIEVPDWVARKVLAGYLRDWDDCSESNKRDLAKIMAESLTAALGAWVVPVAVSREYDASRPTFGDVVPNDSQEADMWAYDLVTLFTLRQEKPE